MPVRLSTGLPNCREGRQNRIGSVSRDGMQRAARLAEDLGFYALWPNEFIATDPAVARRYLDPPNIYDTLITMAFAAAVTERIRLMPSTIVLPLHEPLLLSRQPATLDVFSGGRVSLGVGLGGAADEFRRLHGELEKPNRGRMTDEYIQALRLLWTERLASFSGDYVNITDVEAFPKPIQNPLPIFVAGQSEAMMRRAVQIGQGWIDFALDPNSLRAAIATLRRYLQEAGRTDDGFAFARQFYVSIAPTESEAIANHAAAAPPPTNTSPASSAASSGSLNIQEPALIGTPDLIRARLQEYVAAGATELAVIFYAPDDAATERQMRLFAQEVMPHL